MRRALHISIICVIFYGVNASESSADVSRPQCNTDIEMSKIAIRHIHDPTKYWMCLNQNTPAEIVTCPTEQAFDDITGRCIPWDQWRWVEPSDPILHRESNAYTIGHDGRPGCQTDAELSLVFWRNNNDPTAYWMCSEKNSAGTHMKCPDSYAFSKLIKTCVPLSRWEWTPPIDPPSLA